MPPYKPNSDRPTGDDDDDNASYTSGSSYSFTASSASGDEGGKNETEKKSGQNPSETGGTQSSEPVAVTETESKPPEAVISVENDVKTEEIGQPAGEAKKEEDKSSWLDSDSDVGSYSSYSSDTDGYDSDATPTVAAPQPPPTDEPPQDEKSGQKDEPAEAPQEPIIPPQKDEPAELPQEEPIPASSSVALAAVIEEPETKSDAEPEVALVATKPRRWSETPSMEDGSVIVTNIDSREAQIVPESSDVKRIGMNKKPSLISSSSVIDEEALIETHFKMLEEEPEEPVAVPMLIPPGKSSDDGEPEVAKEPESEEVEYIWESDYHGTNMEILEEEPNVCRRKRAIQATDAVRGKYSLKGGQHVFRFTFNDKPFGSHCSIGVCLKDAALSREGYGPVLGNDEMSWTWDIPSRMLIHGGKNCGQYPVLDPTRSIQNTIFMWLDLDKGTIRYSMEDKDLGPAFEDLPVDDPLHPGVTLVYGNATVTIDLMQTTEKRFVVTPGGVVLPTEMIEKPPTDESPFEPRPGTSSGGMIPIAETDDSKDSAGGDDGRPTLERTKTNSFAAMMNMVAAKEEVSLLHAFDKESIFGFNLHIVPNDPFSCRQKMVGSGQSSGYPSIGSSVALEEGVHMWHVQLRKEYNGNLRIPPGATIESCFSSINPCVFIGLVNDQYKRENNPTNSGMDENSWAWNPVQERIFHADKSKQYPPKPQAQTGNGINLFRGIRVTLDLVQGILCYSYHDGMSWKNLGVAWNDLKGQRLFPHIWLHNCKFAVTMKYLGGNKELMEAPVDYSMVNKIKELSFEPPPEFDRRLTPLHRVSEDLSRHFSWNTRDCSAGILFPASNVRQRGVNKICERGQVPPGQQDVVRCKSGFSTGLNVWIISFDASQIQKDDHYIIGLATERSIAYPITPSTSLRSSLPTVIGSDYFSWAWDLKHNLLYHGGEVRGQFPIRVPDFNLRDYLQFKFTLRGGTLFVDGYHMENAHHPLKFGVMFTDLPKDLQLFPIFGYVNGGAPVSLEYVATSSPDSQYASMRRTSSAMCTVL